MRGYMIKLPDGSFDEDSLIFDKCADAREMCEEVYAIVRGLCWEEHERRGLKCVPVEIREIKE